MLEVQSKTEQEPVDGDETEDDDTEPQVDVQLLILICLLSNDSKAHRKAISLAQQWLTVSPKSNLNPLPYVIQFLLNSFFNLMFSVFAGTIS